MRRWIGFVSIAMCVFVACEPERPQRAETPEALEGRIVAAWYRQPGHGPVMHDGVTVIDLDSGNVEDQELPEFGAGDAQFKLVRVGDRLVFRGSRGRAYGVFSIAADLEGRAEHLARSWYFVPSANPGRIWLTSLDRRPRESGQRLRGVREVDLSGNVTARARARPPDQWLAGALTTGLVFQGDQNLRVWDPDRGRVVTRIKGEFPVAQNGDTLVSCSERCPFLLVTDTATGESRRFLPPPAWSFEATYDGSISPDGSLIATVVSQPGRHRLGLVDLEEGNTAIVRGAKLDQNFGVSAWSASGDWVVFNSGTGELTAYNRSTGALRTFSLGDDHVVMALARGD